MTLVERSRRGKRKRELLGSHQRCWLWGRHAVTETLRAGRWRPLEVHLSEELDEVERERARVAALAVSAEVFVEPHGRLRQLCKSSEHQGYLAKLPPFPYASLQTLIDGLGGDPLVAVLDGVQDPHNFGAILRCADAFGLDGVLIGSRDQVGVTSHVARTSAGAVNHVPIAREDGLVAAVDSLRERGLVTVAATEAADATIAETDLARGLAVILGNEGRGVSRELLEACDERARIPQFGRVGSLNAAVAAGIVFYEVRRQRGAG